MTIHALKSSMAEDVRQRLFAAGHTAIVNAEPGGEMSTITTDAPVGCYNTVYYESVMYKVARNGQTFIE